MYNSLFQKPWWLDAVSFGKWRELAINRNDKIIARCPYTIYKKFEMSIISMPPLTQTLGPWLYQPSGKYTNHLKQQKHLMNSLIKQLPPFDYFSQNFHYSISNWLPFYWSGFQQTTRYTYIIQAISDLDTVWKGFQGNIRKEIRKAQKNIIVRHGLHWKKFLNICELRFRNKKTSFLPDHRLLQRIDKACSLKKARRIFYAQDSNDNIHAAIYIIWDKNSAHYLLGGINPEFGTSGATSLLMWEAIKYCSTVTDEFNFEGSMIESVERFFRGFGAIQKPYYTITAVSRRMNFFLLCRELVNLFFKKNNIFAD
jgi:Acetyltransferase (GNAT) domain